ncbi:D-2-hydroxyacid dehydrogenase [Streptomyces acidiscabies]|uniref:D-2-hydroxyacid dehydrogenase n=1 Tax=Streptomyces acidiscabies TaxID=42234 RepID=A0AAP6BL52_9ACTN|nr:D-2-hydroxyacid dehydrogenase [Streptomyces acidiscabies]MBP5937915.1 D-2-hydroxyacid dehydrogenase [Streptomyces sp. LBUM 1476]MBZ3908916.1 D-2-hydroxyacid dehydrogenase [Streptomyces acidiscabies]MDX2966578.1 D-2-hydroxyacid dehydrogenase [Streptomyces acidiscabies]MDX3016677.1 D-2-hydroxyacid dehydrogenase [Streptomyces acidiscabies]MDX3788415.1 D-2-hydroxyacid dehydrogenase [Streptomyces acidiscabies]
MNRPVVLISLESPHSFWQLSAEHERVLSTAFPGVEFRTAAEEAVPNQLAQAHVYFGWRFEPSWLFGAPRLRWIASPAAGTDHLPVAEARSAGVALTRSYGFHGRPMAEHAMGMVLGFSRGLFVSQLAQRSRTWWKDDLAEEFFDLAGATMTIVGCGSIGEHLARAARSFGMDVIGVRRRPPVTAGGTIRWMHTSAVHQAVAVADVVVDLLPATRATDRFFDHGLFTAFKPKSVFVNLGRAATVDQTALLAALDAGRLRGAALDVFDPKPLPARHPLRLHPRVVLTPKSSTLSRTYMDEAVAFFADNLRRYLTDQQLNGVAEAPAVRSPSAGR